MKLMDAIRDELAEKGYDRDLIVLVTRVKRNNFLHSIFSPMLKGILAYKDNTLFFIRLKKSALDYADAMSFTIDGVIPQKCSLSRGMGRGVLKIKYQNKNKDEFFYNIIPDYEKMAKICAEFFNAN